MWAKSVSAEEAWEIAVEAYLYAYPLVISELTRRVAVGNPRCVPMNQELALNLRPDVVGSGAADPCERVRAIGLTMRVSVHSPHLTTPPSGGEACHL
jgi:hypothetical protein